MKRRNAVLGILFSAAALAAAAELPKAETILDRYVEVTGGKAAYEKIKSEITTGTMIFGAMGLSGKLTGYRQAPDKLLLEVTLEGVGKISEGVSGGVAWSMNAMQGPRLKEGEEKALAIQQARINAESNWRELYKSTETTGSETVEGKDCHKLVLTSKEGRVTTRWYDKQTGLLVKSAMTSKSPMGEIQVEAIVSDYRKEGDILLPHKTASKAAGQEFTMTIDKVEHNAAIPADKFDPPAEVKALMKK